MSVANPEENITSYLWTTPNGIVTTDTSVIRTVDATADDAGLYYVRARRAMCDSPLSDTLDLSLFRTPTPPTISTNTPLCEGGELILEVGQDNNTTYEWIGPEGFISDENRITLDNINAEDAENYGVRIFRNGCPSEYSFVEGLEFLPRPLAPVIEIKDQELCRDQTTEFEMCVDRNSFVAGVECVLFNTPHNTCIG